MLTKGNAEVLGGTRESYQSDFGQNRSQREGLKKYIH